MRDTYGREIEYLRISVSHTCNLNCRYCKTDHKNDSESKTLTNQQIFTLAKILVNMGIRKIRLTGGEPLLNHGIVKLVKKLKSIKGLEEVSLTTNGVLLSNYAKALKKAGLDRVNISLDSLVKEKVLLMTGSDCLDRVLDGIRLCQEIELTPVKINTVLIDGFNDNEISDFVALTSDQGVDVRFIELMPLGEETTWNKERYISSEVITRVPGLKPLNQKGAGPATYYQLPEAKGKVGIISGVSCNFCHDCNRLRLTYDGKLRPCLFSDIEIDLMTAMSDKRKLSSLIRTAISAKPESKDQTGQEEGIRVRNMYEIGG